MPRKLGTKSANISSFFSIFRYLDRKKGFLTRTVKIRKMTFIKTTSLFIVFLITTLVGCVKEEFIKACYDDSSIGCQNLNSNGVIVPIDSNKINFLSSSLVKNENSGLASVFITLSQPAESNITIPFTVTGTLKTNDDVVISGSGVNYNSITKTGTLSLVSGQTYINILMSIVDDATYEATENLMLILANPSGKAVLGTSTTFSLNVADNDIPPWISFDIAASTGLNEGAGTIPVTVNLEYALEDSAVVPILVTGTASKSGVNADHTYNFTTITVPAGVTTFNILVPVIDDLIFEGSETIIITLDSVNNPLTLGAESVHTITLLDNDATPSAEFDIAASTANESQGTIEVTINLSHAVQVAQQIKLNYSGTSTLGTDYSGSTTLTIPVGETSGVLSLSLINDSIYETPETIILTIVENTTNDTYELGAVDAHTITLSDDDPEPKLSFDYKLLSYHADENQAMIKILTETAAGSDITISYDLALAGDALALHVPNSTIGTNTITLPAGETEVELLIDTDVGSTDGKNIILNLSLIDDTSYDIDDITTATIHILNPRFMQIPQDMAFGEDVLISHKANDMIAVEGGYAIASDVGLVITDQSFSQISTFGSSRGLPSNKIQSIYYDSDQQTLIVGTDAGAAVARYDHYSSYTKLSNLTLKNITGAIIDGERIFVTSTSGLEISLDSGETFTKYDVGSMPSLLTNNFTNIVYEKDSQKILLETSDQGIIITNFELSTLTHVNTSTVTTLNAISNQIVDLTLSSDKLSFHALIYNSLQAKAGVYSATLSSPLTGTFKAYAGYTSSQLREVYHNSTSNKVYVVGTTRVSDGTTAKTSTTVDSASVPFLNVTGGRSINGRDFIFHANGILESADLFSSAEMYSAPSDFPTNWKINTMVEFDNSYLIGTDNGIFQIPYTLDSITKLSAQPYKINQMKVSMYDPLFPGLFIASSAGWAIVENLNDLVDDLVVFDPFAAAPHEEVNSISFDPDEDFVALGNPTEGLKIYDTNSQATSTFDISPTMFSDEINDITYAEALDNDSITYIRTFMIATNNTLHQIDIDNMTIFKNTGNDQVNSVFSYEPISTPGIIKNVFTDGTTITMFEDAIYGSGPFIINGQQDITATSFGSPSILNKVLFDVDDVLHLGHDLGYSIQTYPSAPFINYNLSSGLPNNSVKTIIRNDDDKILIGTDTGLCISNDVISVMALD